MDVRILVESMRSSMTSTRVKACAEKCMKRTSFKIRTEAANSTFHRERDENSSSDAYISVRL